MAPGFDSLVQESKGKAKEAFSQAAKIEAQIEFAEERTREAQNALAGAELDAKISHESAEKAKEHAEQASKVHLLKKCFICIGTRKFYHVASFYF